MNEHMRGAHQAGLQIMIHAIGDRANDRILGFYEQLKTTDGAAAARAF
ncbi:MAG: hypothetical protein WKF30_09995 [Pyrinomonadaceae bacterium]